MNKILKENFVMNREFYMLFLHTEIRLPNVNNFYWRICYKNVNFITKAIILQNSFYSVS